MKNNIDEKPENSRESIHENVEFYDLNEEKIEKKISTTNPRKSFKPIQFEWALDACETQHKIHWIPYEIDLIADLQEFNTELKPWEKNIIVQILRFFTQSDLEVARSYVDYYLQIFKCPEIRMMLASFAGMETVHVLGYSYLISSLRFPDAEYSAFLQYKEMVDKYDYMQSFDVSNPFSIALTLAIVSGFIEGMVLFSSFAILMYFPILRGSFGKSCLRGIGQIVSFSIRDETLHCVSMIKLFRVYIEENKHLIDYPALEKAIYDNCNLLLKYEFAFIDLAMKEGELEGMTAQNLKDYIMFLADLRLQQLGLKPVYGFTENPMPWTDTFLFPKELANFFDTTPTSYVKGDFIKSDSFDWSDYK